jgi:hypothetical protein
MGTFLTRTKGDIIKEVQHELMGIDGNLLRTSKTTRDWGS